MAKKSLIAKALRPARFSTQAYHRCAVCGRPRGYIRKFGMQIYRQDTAPVLDFYRGSSVRVEDVNGYGAVSDVTSRIVGALNGDAVTS